MSANIDLIVKRLLDPQFGSDTTERLLMGSAADAIRYLQGEMARLQVLLDSASAQQHPDLVSRAEVLSVLKRLGNQDADLALYGAEDNARAREYGEAAMARACCAVAIMPGVRSAAEPVAWQYRWKLDGEWTNWRVSDASQKHPILKDLEERPLYSRPAIAEAAIAAMTEALIECEDYFDNRADADCDQDGFVPNREMRLLNTIRSALPSPTPEG